MGRRAAEKAKIICPPPSGVDIINKIRKNEKLILEQLKITLELQNQSVFRTLTLFPEARSFLQDLVSTKGKLSLYIRQHSLISLHYTVPGARALLYTTLKDSTCHSKSTQKHLLITPHNTVSATGALSLENHKMKGQQVYTNNSYNLLLVWHHQIHEGGGVLFNSNQSNFSQDE